MANTVDLLTAVCGDLVAADFSVAVFGGWAEELVGIGPSRVHGDIDLLVFDPDMSLLDEYVDAREEIVAKRFSHKRAFLACDVLVELFLVHGGTTTFWDTLVYQWPAAPLQRVGGLMVAPSDWLSEFRRQYGAIHRARRIE